MEKAKASAIMPIRTYQQAKASKFSQDDYNTYRNIILENIEYKYLTYQNYDQELIDSFIEVMLDVILTESPDTVKIDQEVKSRDVVKSVYLKLNSEHIRHVLDQYKAQNHQITRKTAYLRTMLYTVYQEMEPHITNLVRVDGMV